ncbi:chromatin modification-related protein EAF7-like [Arachis duranensis]|uniref:Chromatin modification-related protein EAF7-like n=1 Tax=Arachis duranensis TaxID=130453 RepID=A0A9C6TBJ2_ARADU|nr:chromatin modification-related protein EAF7-like [Arachis duranensis]
MDLSDEDNEEEDSDESEDDDDDKDNNGQPRPTRGVTGTAAKQERDKGYNLRVDPPRRSQKRYTPSAIKKAMSNKYKKVVNTVKKKFTKYM